MGKPVARPPSQVFNCRHLIYHPLSSYCELPRASPLPLRIPLCAGLIRPSSVWLPHSSFLGVFGIPSRNHVGSYANVSFRGKSPAPSASRTSPRSAHQSLERMEFRCTCVQPPVPWGTRGVSGYLHRHCLIHPKCGSASPISESVTLLLSVQDRV